MKIGIRWSKGLLKMDVTPNMTIGELLVNISKRIKVDSNFCALYSSMCNLKFIHMLEKVKTLEECRIKNGDIINLEIKNLAQIPKNIPVAQMAMKSDVIDEFVKKGEKIPESIKNSRSIFGPRVITGAMHEYRDSTIPKIIQQTETSCYAIRIADEALLRFQTISLQDNFKVHRVMFLFGRADKVTGKTTIHCGMEPPQKNFEDHFEISESFNDIYVTRVAECFNMSLLGMAVSHNGTDKLPMPSYLIRLAADYQVRYGELFTTLVVLPRNDSDIEVVAYQVTDAVTKLERMGMILPDPDPKNIHFKVDNKITGVRVFDKLMTKCDVNLCLCSVRIRKTSSKIPSHSFPSLNANPTKLDVRSHLKDNEYCPSWRTFFDFNLLVYLFYSNVFSKFDDLKKLIKCIIDMEDIPKYLLDKVAEFCGYSS